MIQDYFEREILCSVIHLPQTLPNAGELRANGVDDLDRVGTRLAVDWNVDLSTPVDPHDVRLDLGGILDTRHVAHEDGPPIVDRDGYIVQLAHLLRHRVCEDLVVGLADLDVPCGDKDRLLVESTDDVHRRHPARIEPLTINLRDNPPELAAVNGRRDYPGNRLQPIPQLVVRDVVQLLLAHRVGGHADETERHRGRRVEGHDHRRDRPRRQVEHVAHRVGRDLAHRGIETDALAEEVLNDADAEHRVRFLMLDPDGLARPTLESTHDVALHHDGRHAGIEGHDLDRRGGEGRQKIGRQAGVRQDAQHHCDERAHRDDIRELQGASDHRLW